jgi:hypothetical protein
MKKISFKSKLFKWQGQSAWYFITVPEKESKKLRALPTKKKRGFNSIKVRAKIGKTSWDTSLFPMKEGPYLLPIKSAVRRAEGLDDGDTAKVVCILL